MNEKNNLSKTFIFSVFLFMIVVALAVIDSDFTGVIFVKLGIEGGELLIDKQ